MAKRSKSVTRVKEALRQAGVNTAVVELDGSTRTAELAAAAIGTELGSIVKSLLFVSDQGPVLALVAGDRRAAPAKVGREAGGGDARLASAVEVREITGFAVGGVPPLGHDRAIPVLIDRSLGRFATVHAAAGTPHAVFPIAFDQLLRVTQGRLADIVEEG